MTILKSAESGSNTPDRNFVTNIEVMVDIETMGITPGCPVLSIGAVLFDPRQQSDVSSLEERAFVRNIDVADAVKNSNGVQGDTLKWWLQQEDAAIKALVNRETVSLKQALLDFRNYCVDRLPALERKFYPGWSQMPIACRLWAKSPDFDCKILEAACDKVGESMPFKFFSYRCVRTLQDLAWPDGPHSRPKFQFGTAHDAGADAVNQALVVQAGYLELGLSGDGVQFDALPR